MKHLIELSRDDIQKILAKEFNVDIEKIDFIPYIVTEGAGMSEHQVAQVKAFVEISNG